MKKHHRPPVQNTLKEFKYPSEATKWCFYHQRDETHQTWFFLEKQKAGRDANELGKLPCACRPLIFSPIERE